MKNSIIFMYRGMNIYICIGYYKNIDNLVFFFLVVLLSFFEVVFVNLFYNLLIVCYSII